VKGRKPKPSALKALAGNPGKREPNANEPVPPEGVPDPPDHLDEQALAEWRRITALLADMHLLTRADATALALYCQTYSRWRHAELRIAEKGLVMVTEAGYPIQSPYLAIANKAIGQLQKLLASFGLTPADRPRVHAPKAEASDPLEEMIRRAREPTQKTGRKKAARKKAARKKAARKKRPAKPD
jgi:P27 family predicted phage terminase small subunit